MYRPLLGFKQSVHNVVVVVRTYHYDHDTVYDVGNAHVKFQGCTVDEQAAKVFLTIITLPCFRCTSVLLEILYFIHCR